MFGGLPASLADEPQTVLITGANRGIGLEFARQLSARGDSVIGTARKPDEAIELKDLGVRVEQLDVTDSASVQALAARLQGVPIDLLINNAGIGGHTANSFATTDFDEIAHTFDVNSLGPMRVTQALLPNLEAGEGKTVVKISSTMGSIEQNRGGYYGYRASKAALNMFNKSLAAELGKQGFITIVMHPGWVKTRMGGAGAPVEPKDSVAGMIEVIDALNTEDNGAFLDYQGNTIPW
ncbi:MAG: SDR family oxidoreductase [Halioglobus sp.]|nr:SDR family oxidoreductase [Halioglobus sp.]